MFYTTCVGRCVFILSVLEKFAQTCWFATSCCSCAFAATLCILHWHYSEVGGHFGSWSVLERVPRTQRPVSTARSVLTVELSTPQGRKNKLRRKSTGGHGGSEESRLTTTQLSLQLQCFLPSLQCDPVSSWLWGESAASSTWGRPKSRSVFLHSHCSFPSLFTPVLYSPMLLPHVTLYLPYEQSAPPIGLSPLTLTFALPKKTKFLWKKPKSFGSPCLNKNSGRPLSSEDY